MLYNDITCDARTTMSTFYYLKFSLDGCGYMLKGTKPFTGRWQLGYMKAYSGNPQQKLTLFPSILPAGRNNQPPNMITALTS